MKHPVHHEGYISQNAFGFMLGLLVCLISLLILHIVYYVEIRTSRIYTRRRIYVYTFIIIILIILSSIYNLKVTEEMGELVITCILGILMTLLLLFSSNSFRVLSDKETDLAFSISHGMYEEITERWGLLIMIATGESVIALISATDDQFSNHWKDYFGILCTFACSYILRDIYELSIDCNLFDSALVNKKKFGSVLWTLLHGFSAFCLMFIGYCIIHMLCCV